MEKYVKEQNSKLESALLVRMSTWPEAKWEETTFGQGSSYCSSFSHSSGLPMDISFYREVDLHDFQI